MRRAVAGSLLAIVALTGCGSLRGERVMVGEDGGAVELSVPEQPEVVGDAAPAGHEADAPAPVASTSGAPVVAVQASVATYMSIATGLVTRPIQAPRFHASFHSPHFSSSTSRPIASNSALAHSQALV